MKMGDFQIHAEKMFPIVPHLGLRVGKFTSEQCVLNGSWAANKNHIGTVFGGSLYCFSALACYGLIWALVDENKMMTQNIVISDGHIKYQTPVKGDFEVVCQAPESAEVEAFLETLRRKGRARLRLGAQVIWDQKDCAEFGGAYVVNFNQNGGST